jgi:uncharacterized protein YkwD
LRSPPRPRRAGATTDPALVKAVNAERAERHLPALKRSPSLRRSARRYARWMMRHDVFGHQARIHASRRFARLGENLALGFGHNPAARKVVRLWLGSRPHRRLLLARRMHRIGAGKSRGSFRGRRATIWVLHLGVLR